MYIPWLPNLLAISRQINLKKKTSKSFMVGGSKASVGFVLVQNAVHFDVLCT